MKTRKQVVDLVSKLGEVAFFKLVKAWRNIIIACHNHMVSHFQYLTNISIEKAQPKVKNLIYSNSPIL